MPSGSNTDQSSLSPDFSHAEFLLDFKQEAPAYADEGVKRRRHLRSAAIFPELEVDRTRCGTLRKRRS